MGVLEALAIAGGGVAAGAINAMVGSGTLITFPLLLAFGYAPVTANVSNTIGLVPGSLSGVYGYRRELEGQRARTTRLAIASVLGGIVGAVLLLELPAGAFKRIVPIFIGIALVLVLVQPRLSRRLAARRAAAPEHGGPLTLAGLFACGVYGGYFGAAQGIIIVSMLGITLNERLQRINAVKNVLAMLTNLVAALIFIAVAHVAWGAAVLIAAGSIAGGQIGAHVGRRLPPLALRGVIVAVGVAAIVKLVG
ncbi:MAG TPA: sulfite exporter TauE/SafE family protein [Gaiellaceae bacterium]|nr:sulfite exporter TauE/SafE family protein [Gaiellaceae bacterium]